MKDETSLERLRAEALTEMTAEVRHKKLHDKLKELDKHFLYMVIEWFGEEPFDQFEQKVNRLFLKSDFGIGKKSQGIVADLLLCANSRVYLSQNKGERK
jgi:hypothetical protein